MKSPFGKKSGKADPVAPEVAEPAAKPEVAAVEAPAPVVEEPKPAGQIDCPVAPCRKALNHAGAHTQGGVA